MLIFLKEAYERYRSEVPDPFTWDTFRRKANQGKLNVLHSKGEKLITEEALRDFIHGEKKRRIRRPIKIDVQKNMDEMFEDKRLINAFAIIVEERLNKRKNLQDTEILNLIGDEKLYQAVMKQLESQGLVKALTTWSRVDKDRKHKPKVRKGGGGGTPVGKVIRFRDISEKRKYVTNIADLLKKRKKLSTSEVTQVLGGSPNQVRAVLIAFEQCGWVSYRGKARATRYTMVHDPPENTSTLLEQVEAVWQGL